MADVEYRGAENAPQGVAQGANQGASQTRRIARLVNTAGAVMSVALVVGIGVWGYRLLVRDVTGVPVVRALEGPMRVQPADPGGQQTAHQGLSVNRVQANGLAAPTADRLVLAPVGVGITSDDPAGLRRPTARAEATPMAEAAEVASAGINEITAPALLRQDVPMPVLPTVVGDRVEVAAIEPREQPSATDAAVAEALGLADQIAANAKPLSALAEVGARAPIRISASIAGVSRSPRPLGRPFGLNTTPATVSVEVVAARVASAPAAEVDAATIQPGTRLAQLGAYDSAEIAQKEWDRLYGPLYRIYGGQVAGDPKGPKWRAHLLPAAGDGL